MKRSLDGLHLPYRRFRYLLSFNKTRGDVATASSIDNYIGEKKYVSFSPSAMCESTLNLGGERSRLWMLRQGKRAEEAGMIS